jgi:carboxyl-terminal processing protease
LIQKIFQKRIFFELASKFAQRHPKLKESFENFLQRFEVDEELLQEFYQVAQEKDIVITQFDLNLNEKYIKNRLKAEIARSLWGNDKFYIILLENDSQYQQAVHLFPDAEKIRLRFGKNMAINDR